MSKCINRLVYDTVYSLQKKKNDYVSERQIKKTVRSQISGEQLEKNSDTLIVLTLSILTLCGILAFTGPSHYAIARHLPNTSKIVVYSDKFFNPSSPSIRYLKKMWGVNTKSRYHGRKYAFIGHCPRRQQLRLQFV